MSKEQDLEDEKRDELFLLLTSLGFTTLIATNTINELQNIKEIEQVSKEIKKSNIGKAPPTQKTLDTLSKNTKKSGFRSILINAGFSAVLATSITTVLQEDEKLVGMIEQGKNPVIFMTQQDAKVDDKICLPLEGNVYEKNGAQRPRIPLDTHPNCRCFYLDGITGANLGQF